MIFKKSVAFKKYFSSYLFTFLLPTIIFLVFISSVYNGFVKDLIISNSLSELNKSVNYVDSNLISIKNLPTYINTHSSYSASGEYNKYAFTKELSKYTIGNYFIYDIFVYYRNSNTLFSSSYSYDLNYFNKSIFQFNDWDYDSFIYDINNSSESFMRYDKLTVSKGSSPKDVIILGIPSANSGPSRGTFTIILIDKQTIEDIISLSDEKYKNVFILDSSSNVVASSEKINDEAYKWAVEYASKTDISGAPATFRTRDACLIISSSSVVDWKYVAVLDNSLLFKPMTPIIISLCLCLAAMSVIGSILIYYMLKLNYNPIKEIYQYILDKNISKPSGEGEVDLIKSSIINMSDNLYTMEQNLSKATHAMREYSLSNMLNGVYENIEDYNLNQKESSLKIKYPYFFVVNVNFAEPINIDSDFISWIEHDNLPENHVLCKCGITSRHCVLIVDCKSGEDKNVRSFASFISDKLSFYTKISFTMGIGITVSSISELNDSYIKSSCALEYIVPDNSSNMVFYNDIIKEIEKSKKTLCLKEFDNIEYYILNNSWDKLDSAMKELTSTIHSTLIPIYVLKSIAYRIVNTTMLKIKGSNDDILEELVNKGIYIEDIISSLNADYIMKNINSLIEYLKQQGASPSTEYEVIPKIKSYIDENYSNYNFSINQLPSIFNKSISYISKHFKEAYGMGLLDYTNIVRIEKAKVMIITTDLSFKEIADRIGYSTDSSFIRMFKKITGITPGKFRDSSGRQ